MMDKVHILVQAGSGGNGCKSFFRRQDKKIIPYGGDGGNGGRVILRVDRNASPLEDLQYRQSMHAESGGHGGHNRKRGKNGKDLILLLPEGARVYDRQRNLVIRGRMEHDEEMILLEGSRGGKGNYGGKASSLGEKGASLYLEVSVRMTTDVCFIGLPNAGKSRILNRLTRSTVRVEDYPFSTRSPKLGVYTISDYEQLTLCEMPSIFRGSRAGRGLGNDFLKHLKNARLLVYVIDPVSEYAGSLAEGFEILREEVAAYDEAFLDIPSFVVVNKMDLDRAKEQVRREKWDSGKKTFYFSAATGEGLESFQTLLQKMEVRL